MQNDWWTALAERTRRYSDMGDMRAFHEALKAVCGTSYQIYATLCSLDGSTLETDKEAILQRWLEHFKGLSSDQRTCRSLHWPIFPRRTLKLELDPPTREEIKKATMQLKVGKLPGIDGIPAEVLSARGRCGAR